MSNLKKMSKLLCNYEGKFEEDHTFPIIAERSINIYGSIEYPLATSVIRHLNNVNYFDLNQQETVVDYIPEPVTVFINSNGGMINVGLNICSHLKNNMICDIKTIITADGSSAASMIFLAGNVRVVYKDSEMMVHNSSLVELSGDKELIENHHKKLVETDQKMLNFYNKMSLQEFDEDFWKEKIKKGEILQGQEIFDTGLANVLLTDEGNYLRQENGEIVDPGIVIL